MPATNDFLLGEKSRFIKEMMRLLSPRMLVTSSLCVNFAVAKYSMAISSVCISASLHVFARSPKYLVAAYIRVVPLVTKKPPAPLLLLQTPSKCTHMLHGPGSRVARDEGNSISISWCVQVGNSSLSDEEPSDLSSSRSNISASCS